MTIDLVKSRTVFFPDIPAGLGKTPDLYLHLQSLQEEASKQIVGLFDNDSVLRDALNTAVSVAVTATGDMVTATGTAWGVLPIGAANQIMFVDGTQPGWTTPATLGIPAITAATTGAMIYMNKTTGWMHIEAGLDSQQLVYKTDSCRGVWITNLGPTNDPTDTDGKMLVSSGSAWVTVTQGAAGQVLTISGTMPQWLAGAGTGVQANLIYAFHGRLAGDTNIGYVTESTGSISVCPHFIISSAAADKTIVSGKFYNTPVMGTSVSCAFQGRAPTDSSVNALTFFVHTQTGIITMTASGLAWYYGVFSANLAPVNTWVSFSVTGISTGAGTAIVRIANLVMVKTS